MWWCHLSCRALLSFSWSGASRHLHSFPTRRSSDLWQTYGLETCGRAWWLGPPLFAAVPETGHNLGGRPPRRAVDRKSTRLNSSHLGISYAVFCLKKKKETNNRKYGTVRDKRTCTRS